MKSQLDTHETIAADLSLSNETERKVLPNSLDQTRAKINEIQRGKNYDTRFYYVTRIKRTVLLILSRPKIRWQYFD